STRPDRSTRARAGCRASRARDRDRCTSPSSRAGRTPGRRRTRAAAVRAPRPDRPADVGASASDVPFDLALDSRARRLQVLHLVEELLALLAELVQRVAEVRLIVGDPSKHRERVELRAAVLACDLLDQVVHQRRTEVTTPGPLELHRGLRAPERLGQLALE